MDLDDFKYKDGCVRVALLGHVPIGESKGRVFTSAIIINPEIKAYTRIFTGAHDAISDSAEQNASYAILKSAQLALTKLEQFPRERVILHTQNGTLVKIWNTRAPKARMKAIQAMQEGDLKDTCRFIELEQLRRPKIEVTRKQIPYGHGLSYFLGRRAIKTISRQEVLASTGQKVTTLDI